MDEGALGLTASLSYDILFTRAVSSVWLEHLPFKQGVEGSNPSRLTAIVIPTHLESTCLSSGLVYHQKLHGGVLKALAVWQELFVW